MHPEKEHAFLFQSVLAKTAKYSAKNAKES
jgi:hypothetical protein